MDVTIKKIRKKIEMSIRAFIVYSTVVFLFLSLLVVKNGLFISGDDGTSSDKTAAIRELIRAVPTSKPNISPTLTPTTGVLSAYPSDEPSIIPSITPNETPTLTPTDVPTETPTVFPSTLPTIIPTEIPSMEPHFIPTILLSESPTTAIPGAYPSDAPIEESSVTPTTRNVIILSESPSSADSYNTHSNGNNKRESIDHSNLKLLSLLVVSLPAILYAFYFAKNRYSQPIIKKQQAPFYITSNNVELDAVGTQ